MSNLESQTKPDGGASVSTAMLGAWRPIATAPKDTSVLLFDGEIHEGFWDELDYDEFWGRSIMGWNYGNAEIDGSNFSPTHWMPLPEAPNAELRGRPLADGPA